MHKSFKDSIDSRLHNVTAPDDIAARIKMQAHSKGRRTIHFNFKRVVSIAATFCLVGTLSIGVMAASVPQLHSLITLIGQNVSTLLQPVIQKSESNGIAMEVLAAVNDNDTVFIYLTLQDLTGDRLDETLRLYDFSVDEIFAPHAQVINYDEASRTATVRVNGIGGENLDGKKIEVNLKSILSKNVEIPLTDTDITLEQIVQTNPTPQIINPTDRNSWTSHFDSATLPADIALKLSGDNMKLLKQEQNTFKSPLVDWTYVSGYGILDGVLHIQQNPNDNSGRYNNLFFQLGNENGEPYYDALKTTVEFGSRIDESIYTYSDYIEDAILIPENIDYSKTKILVGANTFEHRIDGDWKVVFNLDKSNKTKTAQCIINMNPWEITDVCVSAVGVTLHGRGQMFEYSNHAEIKVLRLDGTYVECDASYTSVDSTEDGAETIVMKNTFKLPIDVKDIASVSINDIVIPLK